MAGIWEGWVSASRRECRLGQHHDNKQLVRQKPRTGSIKCDPRAMLFTEQPTEAGFVAATKELFFGFGQNDRVMLARRLVQNERCTATTVGLLWDTCRQSDCLSLIAVSGGRFNFGVGRGQTSRVSQPNYPRMAPRILGWRCRSPWKGLEHKKGPN